MCSSSGKNGRRMNNLCLHYGITQFLPPELDEAGKLVLLEAMQKTALVGERFFTPIPSPTPPPRGISVISR